MPKTLKSRISQGILGALGLLFFLAALNLASQFVYLRLDLSAGKVYSISPATKGMLKKLEDPVIVKGYFSADLPQPYSSYRDYLKDLLRVYHNYGGKNFEYKFVDYVRDEDFKKEALQGGVAPVRLTYIARDKYEVKDGFMGLVMLYGDRKEVIPVIRDVTGLEYDLTSKIKKLTSKESRVVALLRGKATQELAPELIGSIHENYETRDFDLSKSFDPNSLPKSLLVLGPRELFKDSELARLEQLILRGVPVAFFLDSKNVDVEGGTFFARNLETGLDRLLTGWGLALGKNLVLDVQNQAVSIQQRSGMFVLNNIISYPLMPVITNLSKDAPVTKDLDQIVLPFASAISTNAVKGLTLEVLASSSKLSWTKENLSNLSPMADFNPDPKDPKGPFPVMVALSGKFPVSFKEPPAEIAKSTSDVLATQWIKEPTKESRILLCSSSRALDAGVPGPTGNQVFFLNAVDWLSQDSDLIAIRSKGIKLRPFTTLPGYALKQIIKFMSMFLMPLLVVGWGLARWRQRRKWKEHLKVVFLSESQAVGT